MSKHKREYIPPDDSKVGLLARTICRELAEDDPTWGERHVMDGLTTFMVISGRIQAKAKNRGGFDSESKAG